MTFVVRCKKETKVIVHDVTDSTRKN